MRQNRLTTDFIGGDIVTLKVMSEHPEHGPPARLVVRFFEVHGTWDKEGELVVDYVLYWCRALIGGRDIGWALRKEQDFRLGTPLRTGEVLVHEDEICLYEDTETAQTAKET